MPAPSLPPTKVLHCLGCCQWQRSVDNRDQAIRLARQHRREALERGMTGCTDFDYVQTSSFRLD